MKFIYLFLLLLIFNHSIVLGQEALFVKFKKLSTPEKWWVISHPFSAKKALIITNLSRKTTQQVLLEQLLKGDGNSNQLDAFRHTFWMAQLTNKIGWRRSKRLGVAHEKGNYKEYKKHRNEDGALPDEISSAMDLFNNNVGIQIGKISSVENIKSKVIEAVLLGKCKIIKKDNKGNYLDSDGNVLSVAVLKGTWKNKKCLVWSNWGT